ncbi:MAG TPA: hypothetical protein VLK82_04985 [Candidatus Tectomicrobia bacterium]|nr:hypothetical protein [Candidatus Tectomicrobia bacterium]
MRRRPSISVARLEPHRITTADRTALKPRSVHPHVDLVVLSRDTQDARLPGENPLGQSHLRQDRGQPLRQHRLPRPRRAEHQEVWGTTLASASALR